MAFYTSPRSRHVDLGSTTVKDFAAKEKQGYRYKDYENHQHGNHAGAGSSAF